jgi:plasmid maintenance system antidote protein VapI
MTQKFIDVNGARPITTDTALRLGLFFNHPEPA